MSGTGLPPGVAEPGLPPYIVVFGPDANCTLDICPVVYSVYGYRPALGANFTFIALYGIAATIHLYLGIRWKQWWFMGCMLASAISAVIGYAGRILMYYNPFNFSAFMLQIICVNTSPVYYCAAIYITLALTINYLAPELSRIKPKLFYYTFIPCDILSLAFQAAGGAMSTTSAGDSKLGIDLSLVGLSFQVLTLVVFCAFFGDYLFRYFRSGFWRQRSEANEASDNGGRGLLSQTNRLMLFFGFMGVAILLTLVRCAYRLAELHEGYSGNLARDEPLFIGFEGVMIIISVFCLMVGHPGFVFKSNFKTVHGRHEHEQELGELKTTSPQQM